MRTAIIGAGSIGTIAGAYLTDSGINVELIDAYQEHVNSLNQSGAKVTGTTEFHSKVRAITPEQKSGTYDLVLLLTKQLENESILKELLPYLHEDSIVCSLQNGIPEETVTSIVGERRVIAGSIEFGATFIRPGVSSLTTSYPQFKKFAFQIGELNGEFTDRIQRIKEVLSRVGGTHISDNLIGTKWSKLLINSAFSGLSTALNCTYGDIIDHETSIKSAVHIANETIKVGHSNGVSFATLHGFDMSTLELDNNMDIPKRIQALRQLIEPSRLLKASMLQDLEKKRKTEINYINGVVSNKAKEASIATPYNDLVIKQIKEAEKNQVIPNKDINISAFKQLLEVTQS